MSSQRIKIPRASDKVVAKAFRGLGEKYGVTHAAVSALGAVHLGNVELNSSTGDWGALLKHNATLIESISFAVGGFHVSYYRGGNYSPEGKSPIYDEVLVSPDANQSVSAEGRLEVLAYLTKELKAFDPGRTVSGLSEDQAQLLAIHQGTLERLEALNEELIKKSADFRQDVEAQFNQKVEANELVYQQRRGELEAAFQSRSAEVDRREDALNETLKRIDDRSNTHVRREIRDRMLDDVKSRIERFSSRATT